MAESVFNLVLSIKSEKILEWANEKGINHQLESIEVDKVLNVIHTWFQDFLAVPGFSHGDCLAVVGFVCIFILRGNLQELYCKESEAFKFIRLYLIADKFLDQPEITSLEKITFVVWTSEFLETHSAPPIPPIIQHVCDQLVETLSHGAVVKPGFFEILLELHNGQIASAQTKDFKGIMKGSKSKAIATLKMALRVSPHPPIFETQESMENLAFFMQLADDAVDVKEDLEGERTSLFTLTTIDPSEKYEILRDCVEKGFRLRNDNLLGKIVNLLGSVEKDTIASLLAELGEVGDVTKLNIKKYENIYVNFIISNTSVLLEALATGMPLIANCTFDIKTLLW
jgi:hypothetical protein